MVETQRRTAPAISAGPSWWGARGRPAVVEIYDQMYQLRGVKTEHIERLAEVVDGKMRAVSAHGATVDSLRVAVWRR